MSDTLERLNQVFRRVFDDDEISLTPETTAANIPAWDSINHVNLMISVEREFKLRLASSEIASLKNVGELMKLLDGKKAK